MNLGLLLWYSVPMALAAIGVLVVIAAMFLGLGLWQVRRQRHLVVLSNKLNNQAFQTLRGLPKLRVAAAERSRGLGAAMLDWAHEHGRTRGALLAQVTTDGARERARTFYERRGYETTHVGLKRPL